LRQAPVVLARIDGANRHRARFAGEQLDAGLQHVVRAAQGPAHAGQHEALAAADLDGGQHAGADAHAFAQRPRQAEPGRRFVDHLPVVHHQPVFDLRIIPAGIGLQGMAALAEGFELLPFAAQRGIVARGRAECLAPAELEVHRLEAGHDATGAGGGAALFAPFGAARAPALQQALQQLRRRPAG
jgi:hypothetical protein